MSNATRRDFLKLSGAATAAALSGAAVSSPTRAETTIAQKEAPKMSKVSIGINMEFVRRDDKSFEWGVAKAGELGYEYVEPLVMWGRDLLSEGGYYHCVSMLDDPYRIRRACEKAGVKLSSLSGHSVLCKPDAGTDYLKQAIRFAHELGAPVVNTDEGPKQPWTTEEEDHVLMRYTLREAAAVAEPRGVVIGLEMHQQYTKTPKGFDRVLNLVASPAIGVNFDTGNSYLAGQDPIAWLEHLKPRLVHVHAKDITVEQSSAERGKVTGTPVGCACGEGVIDWAKVIAICKTAPRDIVLSVECGTIEQAERSIKYLRQLL
jgi:sugar phosphate isomerase/epimerase